MSDAEDVVEFLKQRGVKYVTAVRVDDASRTIVLEIPVSSIAKKATAQLTSRRQIAHLQGLLAKKFGSQVEIAFRQTQPYADLEAGLRAQLLLRWAGLVEDVYMSFPAGDTVYVWVILGGGIEHGTEAELRLQIQEFVRDSTLTLLGLEFVGRDRPLPSIASILRAVKLHAPVTVYKLVQMLRDEEFSVPDEGWLSKKLDLARKKGLVVRESRGAYLVTATGLAIVPSSRSGSSTDIDRILLLARRKEW